MRLRSDWRIILGYLIPGLGLVAIALTTGLDFAPYHDEQFYIPLSHRFAHGITLRLIRTYDGFASSAGPLMYATYGAWLRIVGDGARAARSFSVLLMSLAGVVAVDVGRLSGVRNLIWFGLAVLALPHYATCGITVLSEPMALLGGLLAVDCWLRGLRSRRDGWFWLAAFPMAVAINARPTQLGLVLALSAIGSLVDGIRLAKLAPPALAILAQVPHWCLWGGPFPPTQTSGMIPGLETRAGVNLTTLVHLISFVGFVLWPALIAGMRRVGPPRLSWVVVSIVIAIVTIYAMYRPDLAARFAGPLATLGRARGGILRPLLAVLYFAGALMVVWAARLMADGSCPAVARTVAAVALANLLIYVLSPLAFERYSLMSTPLWLAFLVPQIEQLATAWAVWRVWILALIVGAALSVIAIERSRPVGQWELTAWLPAPSARPPMRIDRKKMLFVNIDSGPHARWTPSSRTSVL